MCQSSQIPSFINSQDHAKTMSSNFMTNEVNASSPKMHLPTLKEHVSLESFAMIESGKDGHKGEKRNDERKRRAEMRVAKLKAMNVMVNLWP